MSEWLYGGVGVTLLGLVGLLGHQGVIQIQLKQLAKQTDGSPLFQKKLAYLQTKKRQQLVGVLLGWGIGLTLLVLIGWLSLYPMERQRHQLVEETRQLKTEVQRLRTTQLQWMQASGFQPYPKEGIEVDRSKWAQLTKAGDSRKAQGRLEQALSQQLFPYLGMNTVILLPGDQPNTWTLAIQSEEGAQEAAQRAATQTGLVATWQQVPEIRTIQFHLMATTEEKTEETATWVYTRTTAKAAFTQVDG